MIDLSSSRNINVVVVDDHPYIRIGLTTSINAQDDMTVVAEAGNGEDAVQAFHEFSPDVMLMDIGLPRINGVEAVRKIRSRRSNTKIIMLTMYEGDEDVYQALKAGADGYVLKGMSHQTILDAIRTVNGGERFIPPTIAEIYARHDPATELRPREKEVLSLIISGKSNKEIASSLNIAEGTVKCHVSAIFLRLGVTDRTQAAMIARQRGLTRV